MMALFGSAALSRVQTLIDPTLGTAIGDMTSGGGLAAAFDGVVSQNAIPSATSIGVSTGYIGKSWPAAKIITGFRVYGSSDYGFDSVSGSGAVITATLLGNTVNNTITATALGSGTVNDFNASPSIVVLTGLTISSFAYSWIKIESTTASQNMFCAECQFYEDV